MRLLIVDNDTYTTLAPSAPHILVLAVPDDLLQALADHPREPSPPAASGRRRRSPATAAAGR